MPVYSINDSEDVFVLTEESKSVVYLSNLSDSLCICTSALGGPFERDNDPTRLVHEIIVVRFYLILF
jgi:hypothetical protein